jgi:hypothetical protein
VNPSPEQIRLAAMNHCHLPGRTRAARIRDAMLHVQQSQKEKAGRADTRREAKVQRTSPSVTPNTPRCALCQQPARLAISLVTEIDGALVGTGICIACIEKRGGHFSQADRDLILGRQGARR